jgi:O-antigen ligase
MSAAGPPLLRHGLVALAVLPPFAIGAVHAPAWVPLLVAGGALGLASWLRERLAVAFGAAPRPVPGAPLVVAALGLVSLQLIPLPPLMVAWLSPGAAAFHDRYTLVEGLWRPLSVAAPATLRGLGFLLVMALLYAAASRELSDPPSRRRLFRAMAITGGLLVVIALVQARSAAPARIYGLYEPFWKWAVFGPYVNRNHFAGYLIPVVALSLALVGEALGRVRSAASRRRHRRWLALGEPAGAALLLWGGVALLVVVGLFAAGARSGLLGLLGSLAALCALSRRRRLALALLLLLPLSALWTRPMAVVEAIEGRGVWRSRGPIWTESLRLAADVPLTGAGLNAYGPALMAYRSWQPDLYVGEAHNEYLQALTDLGLPGLALLLAFLANLLRRTWRAARAGGSLEAGGLAAVCGVLAANAVDFNWQIPANAAAFAILAGSAAGSEPRA